MVCLNDPRVPSSPTSKGLYHFSICTICWRPTLHYPDSSYCPNLFLLRGKWKFIYLFLNSNSSKKKNASVPCRLIIFNRLKNLDSFLGDIHLCLLILIILCLHILIIFLILQPVLFEVLLCAVSQGANLPTIPLLTRRRKC